MSTIILNAKVDPLLKEAIRIVSFRKDKSNSSATVVRVLSADREIAREYKKLSKSK